VVHISLAVMKPRFASLCLLFGTRNELQIMQRVQHKNIVRLYDVFEDDTSLYIVMEALMGGELFDRIKQQVRLRFVLPCFVCCPGCLCLCISTLHQRLSLVTRSLSLFSPVTRRLSFVD
jgi:serine/threonine protein kinase